MRIKHFQTLLRFYHRVIHTLKMYLQQLYLHNVFEKSVMEELIPIF